ncbi:MAG: hypothetical protein A3G34_14205 [Candidatus Lindowbacteria bacterium RIFCSPLOWO2_12_FULL_62_27]|nr:MAG: hypothetical protein A3I06_15810 [Candidatus Lindowbacteria bacterium RIFCSPLOWO2_02_FULL_62_12]OGH62718.1 MAG: hypothetical protein A3G34_14205 [Candidatus Lindowbacteria bacterium RIFCSPLOWO2_12_FULL_62_27]
MAETESHGHEIVCIIQARVRSARLPGKVLKEVAGKTVLEHLISRVQSARRVDRIILATGADVANRPLEKIADASGVSFFSGSETDVLDRYYRAVQRFRLEGARGVVRITGDCPLIDPAVVDAVIRHYLDHDLDYVSNTVPPAYPDGLDTEVFSFRSLETAWREAAAPYDREHVTPYITGCGRFALGNVACEQDLSHERWTLDYPEDWELIRRIFERFSGPFGMTDILKYRMEQPALFLANQRLRAVPFT